MEMGQDAVSETPRKSILKKEHKTSVVGDSFYYFPTKASLARLGSIASASRVYSLDREDMAGPMWDSDILHGVTLFFACVSLALCVVSLAVTAWLTHYDKGNEHRTSTLKIQRYTLWEVRKCSDSGIVCYVDQGEKTAEPFPLAQTWILGQKITCSAGTAFVLINIILQLVNWFSEERSLIIQTVSMRIITLAAIFLTLAGYMAQNFTLWQEWKRDSVGNLLKPSGGPVGMILLSVVSCTACAVFTHVASRGPGALSRDTRFLYRRKSTAVHFRRSLAPRVPSLKPRPPAPGLELKRVRSTEV